MKRFGIILLTLLWLLTAAANAESGANLVVNGDFSAVDSSGLPSEWAREMWFTDAGVSTLYVELDGYDGNSIAVCNADPNDARFTQVIDVEPNSLYRFRCMVRAQGCGGEGYGATISFENTFSYSEQIADTNGEWRELIVYGQTGASQDTVKLMLRIGGYGGESRGQAWFDDVEAVKVDSVPAGFEAVSLDPMSPSENRVQTTDDSDEAPKRNTEAYLLLSILFGVAVLACARKSERIARAQCKPEALLMLALAAALLLRILLCACVRGYKNDIDCFISWSERMFANGPLRFYGEDYFCDYPPGYMLLLWIPAAIRNLFGIPLGSAAHLVLIKALPVAADLLAALLVWRVASRHGMAARRAAVLAAFFALNPAVFIDSAAWGQIDSVFTLPIALCALWAADGCYLPSLLSFAVAMLLKPQAMLFAPLGLFAIIVWLIRRRNARAWLNFAAAIAAALALIYAAAFLFCVSGAQSLGEALTRPVAWIIRLYADTMGSYAYLTINALNLYALLGFNWTSTAAQPAWTAFAWCMFGLAYAFSAFLCAKSKRRGHLLLAGGALIALIFTFGPMIHERYIFPALLLLTLAYALERDRRLLAVVTVMTITAAMNELLVLQGGVAQTGNYGHLQASEQWLNALLSLTNVLNTLYLCWVALDICAMGHVRPLRNSASDEAPLAAAAPEDHRLRLRKQDWIAMAAVTLLYAAVAFVNLGTTQAPQTEWISSQAGESIVFDLGAEERFRMTYYGGVCNSTFRVALSNDGENWTEPCRAEYAQGVMFRWLWFVPRDEDGAVIRACANDLGDGSAYLNYASSEEEYPLQTARYVRICAVSAGLRLGEIGFLRDGEALLPVRIVEHTGMFDQTATDPNCLIDEQDTVVQTPSYYNGTYFDEIYHARTAYELVHGLSIYEWTHPPLGKVLMSLGVRIFGMTPFGWRFMGALMGVLMLPLMYLLAMQLTKSSKLSLAAMLLMALDSMHFTQTRIATIDSYAVFWIMLMYLFMIRAVQMDWRRLPLKRVLVPLGLCGITMGVAIATKWIGIYAAGGLAILLFWKMGAEIARAGKDRAAMIRRALWIILFCVVFFIVLPLLIYYFSYTGQLKYDGVNGFADMLRRKSFERVFELQKSMLSYHAGLGGDTHFFRSPWYQWPIIWWPMWYFSGTAYMPDGVISSISCMGNPAVWWSGLIALILLLFAAAWRRRAERSWLIVLIGFASQFLPWVLVPRSTFIYHYFASVPFIILCVVLALDLLRKRDRRAAQIAAAALLGLALVLFIAFYPLESGMPVARSYAQHLRWFKWYNF